MNNDIPTAIPVATSVTVPVSVPVSVPTAPPSGLTLTKKTSLSETKESTRFSFHLNCKHTPKHSDRTECRIYQLKMEHEFNPEIIKRIYGLCGIEVVIIADNSGSMSHKFRNGINAGKSRWSVLKKFIETGIYICTAVDESGPDIYFLNNDRSSPLYNVTDSNQISTVFDAPPSGYTPLSDTFRNVLEEKKSTIREKGLLILFVTDGQPTTRDGSTSVTYRNRNGTTEFISAIEEFKRVLTYERASYETAGSSGPAGKVFVTMMACTDVVGDLEYMQKWDNEIPNLDVIGDYESEKNDILKVQGPSFSYSESDHMLKALLGSSDPWFDGLDEVRVGTIASTPESTTAFVATSATSATANIVTRTGGLVVNNGYPTAPTTYAPPFTTKQLYTPVTVQIKNSSGTNATPSVVQKTVPQQGGCCVML
jgi:hypothetical protein